MADTKRLDIAVLISGRGSNLQALIDACARPDFPARIVCVISNTADAGGLDRHLRRREQRADQKQRCQHLAVTPNCVFGAILPQRGGVR